MPVEPEQISSILERLAQLEARVAFLSRRLGVEMTPPPGGRVSSEVSRLLREGNRNEAIRQVMRETGAGLKDAIKLLERAGY